MYSLSSMSRWLQNLVFWDEKFGQAWRSCWRSQALLEVGFGWSRRVDEKRSYWREHGRKQELTPNQAVFKAVEDIANSIYIEHSDRERMQSTWLELALIQKTAADSAKLDGQQVLSGTRLSDRWQTYYAAYCAKREEERSEKDRRAAEVQSHRFDRDAIDDAWHNLLAGNLSDEVRSIWLHSGSPRKTAHEIATQANVSIRDFVFWMVVLRDHGLMYEDIVWNEVLYSNCEDRKNLDREVKLLVDRLAGQV